MINYNKKKYCILSPKKLKLNNKLYILGFIKLTEIIVKQKCCRVFVYCSFKLSVQWIDEHCTDLIYTVQCTGIL